jgi:hypothetical protein
MFQILQIPSISSLSSGQFSIILVVIALYLTFRAYRGFSGMKYNERRVYSTPILYLLITIIGLADVNPTYTDIAASAIALIVGYLVGRRLAGGVKFYEKNNSTYYKRSPLIIIVWLISFLARFAIGYLYPTSLVLAVIVEIVLAGTTGMILGEAHHIINAYKKYAVSGQKST